MKEIDFNTELPKLGFKQLGSGWYANELDDIRIRLWKNDEVDFWLWRSSVNWQDNEILFRGKIYSVKDVEWVLERCFDR